MKGCSHHDQIQQQQQSLTLASPPICRLLGAEGLLKLKEETPRYKSLEIHAHCRREGSRASSQRAILQHYTGFCRLRGMSLSHRL
jgi:hypothetical protein